jgi:hypothetical protein
MTAAPNPVATEHLPFFVTAPGNTDVLFNIMVVFTIASVVLLGLAFLTIHSLPERMAHKSKKVQLDIVAVLCLLALFTNEHVYWISALLLAFIEFPDLATPFRNMVKAVETMAYDDASGTSSSEEAPSDASKRIVSETPRADNVADVYAGSIGASRQVQKEGGVRA